MAARKLRERLGMISEASSPEPEVKVPPADKAGALVEAAESGFAAIQALYADRNRSVELAQSLHRETVYLRNINAGLRDEIVHVRQERDHHMKLNARISAWVVQAHDLLGRISAEVMQTAQVIEHMEPAEPVTNNPDVPPLNSIGLPIPEPEQRQFDQNGVPFAAAPTPSPDDLKKIIHDIQQREANGHV